jgi:hypothetical protein
MQTTGSRPEADREEGTRAAIRVVQLFLKYGVPAVVEDEAVTP